MSLLHEPGDYFALQTSSGSTLGLVSLFVPWWCVSDLHEHTNICILLTRLLGGWWFEVKGQGSKSGSTAHVPPGIFLYKTLSYEWKHWLSLFEMAEQSGLLDLSKEFMASREMLWEQCSSRLYWNAYTVFLKE
jgi:hypothetical protein